VFSRLPATRYFENSTKRSLFQLLLKKKEKKPTPFSKEMYMSNKKLGTEENS